MSFAWVEGLVSGLNEQKFPDGGTLFGFFLTSLDNKWPEAVLKAFSAKTGTIMKEQDRLRGSLLV